MFNGKKHKFWAIVPAAGSGLRMQAGVPKQYLELHGLTILQHSLDSLLAEERIQQVVLCIAETDTYWPEVRTTTDARVINTLGGDTRAQSVLNGIQALAEIAKDKDWVLVHDAARPCLSQQLLGNMIDTLSKDDVGGILAVRAKDTLKQGAAGSEKIESTIDRSHVWQAQTPQMFRYGLLRDALQASMDAAAPITDEASAVEFVGYQPRLVEGDASNIKVTTPEDLVLAEAILNR